MTERKHRLMVGVMVFTLFLWGISNACIAQETDKDNITLSVKDESVEKVLKRLGKETDFNFFYDPSVLNTVSLVTLDVRGASLQNVLDLISAQTGLSFKRTDKTISVSKGKEIKNSRSKNGNITGIVRDHAGEPVIGASIQIKGTTLGTITDYNGQFSLNDVPADGVLTVSYIGFNTEDIPVNHQKNLQIVMRENAEQLEEVVVVAYGTAKKSSFTGSAEVVKQDRIEKRVVADVSKALEGTVAGVQSTSGSGQPGEGASMIIRGFGSISAANTPLYVIDGVPFDGALNTLNPNDIESVTVLKDASAGALYGSRGANGVIMITTKRGKKDDGHISINLKANWGISQRALPRYETVNEAEYLELAFDAYKNELIYTNGVDPELAGIQALEVMKGTAKGILGINEQYNPFDMPLNQLIDPMTGKINPAANLKYHEDWKDEITTHNPLRQEYQLAVTGGNSKTQYLVSMGYLNEQGLLQTTEFERYSGRVNIDSQARDWLKLGLNASFAQTGTNYNSASGSVVSNLWYTTQIMAPIYPVYEHNTDGSFNLDANGNRIYDYGLNRIALSNSNAIALLHEDKENSTRDNFNARTYIQLSTDDEKYGTWRGFTLTANFGLDYFNTQEMTYNNPYTGNAATISGSLTKAAQRKLSYTFNQLLTYKREFGSHELDLLVGHEYYQLKQNMLNFKEKIKEEVFMSTPHNQANKGDIAKTVLMPGDPLRAKYLAETYLENVKQFNATRNMFGYTGTYKGKEVSIMGSGMGMPSIGIYSYELFHFYDVENIIRIGSCGSFKEDVRLRDIIIVQGACTDSNYAHQYELPGTYSAISDYSLLEKAVEKAKEKNLTYHVGNVLSSDLFYHADNKADKWIKM